MRFFLLALSLVTASAGAAESLWQEPLTCRKPGIFRFAYAGQMREEASSYCFDQGRSLLVSQNCEKGACEALGPRACALPAPAVPSFELASLCRELGGFPQEGAFYDGERWWDMNRCYFEKDKSFTWSG